MPFSSISLSIKGRLLLILGLAALAIALASVAALAALAQARAQIDLVSRREIPAVELAQHLAQIGERLQDRMPALMMLKDGEARRGQMALIDADLQSLAREAGRLTVLHRSGIGPDADFSAPARDLAESLRSIASLSERLATLGEAGIAQRDAVIALRERVQQILGPSLLAVADVVGRDPPPAPAMFMRAALAQGTLQDVERLFGSAFGELLIAAEAATLEQIQASRQTFERVRDQLADRVPELPSGLQAELRSAIRDLGAQLEPTGLFALRAAELGALAEADRLEIANRRIASLLKARADALVLFANASIARAAAETGGTLLTNTFLLILASVAAVLTATWLSYRLVVRDVSFNLMAVTQAMRRLADGERDARIPAMDRRDEIGDLARVFNIFKNQAFRVETLDRQLTEKSNLLLATFDSMNDGFTVFDEQECLIAWNPRFLQLYGLADTDVGYGSPLGRIHGILAGKGARAFTTLGEPIPMDALASARRALNQQYEVRCPGGRMVELRSNPMPNGGFVTIHIEVSERRAMEHQLRQAQKMEAVGQLTGGIAHDFNNILAAILGNLSALEPGLRQDDALHERWRRAMGAADRAARQVERLLAFSRRQRLEPERVDINALVEGMMELLEYSLGERVRLDSCLAPELPPVRVDPGQLENALMNLAINARDAMSGEGRIRIETALRNGTDVEIRVADSGCGIPAELIDRVYEPFFTTKERGKGSGLGLSMVYGFVRQSGGDVLIESQMGQGTRVCIRLPGVLDLDGADPDQEPEAVSGERAIPAAAGEACILVVDDDPDLLAASVDQLRSLGYLALAAADGVQALDAIGSRPEIALLYTDVGLPAPWDGFSLAAEARARRPGLAVLFTSAQSHPGRIADADLLRKPVSLETLAERVGRAFRR